MNLSKLKKIELVKIIHQNSELKKFANNLNTEIEKCEDISVDFEFFIAEYKAIIKEQENRIFQLENTLSEYSIESQKVVNKLTKKANKRWGFGPYIGAGVDARNPLQVTANGGVGLFFIIF